MQCNLSGAQISVRIFYPRYSREEVLARLSQGVEVLKERLPLTKVVLFGSYASGRYTAASDIDVLVIYAGRPRADALATVKRSFNLLGVEPHVYAEEEAQQVPSTLQRMTQGGVTLYSRLD